MEDVRYLRLEDVEHVREVLEQAPACRYDGDSAIVAVEQQHAASCLELGDVAAASGDSVFSRAAAAAAPKLLS